jgi:hypothetical protein
VRLDGGRVGASGGLELLDEPGAHEPE